MSNLEARIDALKATLDDILRDTLSKLSSSDLQSYRLGGEARAFIREACLLKGIAAMAKHDYPEASIDELKGRIFRAFAKAKELGVAA